MEKTRSCQCDLGSCTSSAINEDVRYVFDKDGNPVGSIHEKIEDCSRKKEE